MEWWVGGKGGARLLPAGGSETHKIKKTKPYSSLQRKKRKWFLRMELD
jgi:hypothetical protein